jgi:hypothetical protein
MEYYSAIKKNEIMLFAGKWMELQIIMLSEINQVLHMWNLDLNKTKDMNIKEGL